MTAQEYRPPSVRQLDAVVDSLAGSVSAGRLRQLRMTVGMFARAVGREELAGRGSRKAARLFDPDVLGVFWDLAVAGELRHWDKDVGKELSLASQRIVRDCLAILARQVVPGRVVALPSLPQVELKEAVGGQQVTALYRELVELASGGPLEFGGAVMSQRDRTRLLAIMSVVLDTGARSGELAAMTLDDLGPGEAWVGVRRRQQKGPRSRAEEIADRLGLSVVTVQEVLADKPRGISQFTQSRVWEIAEALDPVPEVERYELREGSRVAVRRWLKVREQVVAPLEGAKTALWVRLWPNRYGPAGLPLRAQGLRQSYARGMTALNMLMAGQYGWSPMPRTLEQLRRAVPAVPLEEPGP